MDRTIRVTIPLDYFAYPEYVEHQKRMAADKLAIELYQDIASRKNHSVVLIKDREWIAGNTARPEKIYEITYELTESKIRDVVFHNPPKLEYKPYNKFTWSNAIQCAVIDIKSRLKNIFEVT